MCRIILFKETVIPVSKYSYKYKNLQSCLYGFCLMITIFFFVMQRMIYTLGSQTVTHNMLILNKNQENVLVKLLR